MIGLFNDCFPPIMDGVSLTMQNYAFWLHKKTQNVCVVTPKNPEAEDCTGYPVFRYSSAPIPMRKPYRLGFPVIDWPFQFKLSRLSFELAHAHCPFSSGKLAVQVARSQNIPLIATFHSKYRTDIERIISNKYLVDLLIKKIVRFYEMADEVWIPQASVEETLREYGYKGKVEVVNNGSDLTLDASSALLRIETRRRLGIREGESMFLFVGQHIWEKNIGFILDSLALIRDLPFQMFFVGSGYAYQEMVDRVAERNLSHKIHFLGNVADRNVLKSYYTAADLFLFPSLYDNAPLVVREAAGLHTPSLLLRDATCADEIVDNYNGFLSEHSVDFFADRLQELMMNPKLVGDVGLRASSTIVRSWEDIADEVYDRYQRLIHKSRYNSPRCFIGGVMYERV